MKSKNLRINKRQWGTERDTEALPVLHAIPSTRKLTLSRIAIILTISLWIIYIFSIIIRQLIDGPQNYHFTMEAFSYSLVVSMLTFSSLMYLIARHGALRRFGRHTRVPRAIIDEYFTKVQPSVTVLVPSYCEEYEVIRKTIISAALQEYPNLRIVLLLDDNPYPTDPKDIRRLEITRKIGKDIKALLSEPLNRSILNLKNFHKNYKERKYVSPKDIKNLSSQYEWASNWLKEMAKKEKIDDHVDIFFTNEVLNGLAKDLKVISDALLTSANEGARIPTNRVEQLYKRLVWIFQADFDVFERKRYPSLSHEANKAMNLNSYIGLMGETFQNIKIPDSEYILTLDADSILLREYCLRLVYFMQQPENHRVAVTQTPYSSFRGAFSRIERIAGATTDIQHILHQGMSEYNATFWVGANAIIRKSALDDIVEKETVNGFEVKRFIQDRTVIEDTESTIDLGIHGWKLCNYPERLSYSATPPDFGSLVVQRRRWANGGLLILPKLWSQIRARKQKLEPISKTEILLRVNYMASIAWSTFGLIFLLAYPYDGRLLSPLVLLAALPYFIAMASDLKYCRYKYTDVLRIYGFNLIMLPVNLAGVTKSIEQAITGKKIPFARTPKIKNRTTASVLYVVSPLLIVAFSIFTAWRNILLQNWGNALFAGFNAITATWAIIAYIGIFNLLTDIWIGFTDWLYVEDKPKSKEERNIKTKPNWKVVLYQGETA